MVGGVAVFSPPLWIAGQVRNDRDCRVPAAFCFFE